MSEGYFGTMGRLRIGVIGCGNISATYLSNASLFPQLELRACADMAHGAAEIRATEFGLKAMSVDELMAADNIDLILNLTVPNAHFDVSMAALRAGKHVFTEKPLAATAALARQIVAEARNRNLMLGSAPDTFLGAAGRLARRLMDDGAIGKPVAGTAFMLGRGMEHWHPNPQFFYQPGGGPALDMGPYYVTMLVNLLGPAKRVMALTATGSAERRITAPGPSHGTAFSVGTPTTALALVEFANGAAVTMGFSWDVYRHSNQPIELHGTEGSLRLPDPDTFGGTLGLSEGGKNWQELETGNLLDGEINWPYAAPDRANYRMLGLADLARALDSDRQPRASGGLALHVLEILEAILVSGQTGTPQIMTDGPPQPRALTEQDARALRGKSHVR